MHMNPLLSSEHALLKALTYVDAHINEHLPGKAWVGRTAWAYWLISALKSKFLVELGTHGGGSYFSFCQSVIDNELDTKTYAVATWAGEDHAGSYAQSVFENVSRFNHEHFATLSTLIKMTFAEDSGKFD
jgi:hypothetical protein